MSGRVIDGLVSAGDIPCDYARGPSHAGMIRDRDVMVPMRDGVRLCIDIYRPDTDEKLPALLAFAIYNKDLQGPGMAEALPPQPAWAPMWAGLLEAGDTHFLVSRGYVHVIGSPRGVGKSEGGGSRVWDSYARSCSPACTENSATFTVCAPRCVAGRRAKARSTQKRAWPPAYVMLFIFPIPVIVGSEVVAPEMKHLTR
jgi:hypothetical protein